jgi:ring-1,2-phenylacetyl-CoA epoxidase subunit PaaB
MSKVRQNVPAPRTDDVAAQPTGDLRPYVIFTQLKPGGPHIYAGWLDAPDDDMAIVFAKEHYGRDQECVGIHAIRREHIAGTEAEYPASTDAGALRSFEVFTQKKPGDLHLSAGRVEANSPRAAIELARGTLRQAKSAHSIWVVDVERIIATAPGETIWRTTDQTYRLARGYSKTVREKWTTIRAEQDLAEYEKDDLKEAF